MSGWVNCPLSHCAARPNCKRAQPSIETGMGESWNEATDVISLGRAGRPGEAETPRRLCKSSPHRFVRYLHSAGLERVPKGNTHLQCIRSPQVLGKLRCWERVGTCWRFAGFLVWAKPTTVACHGRHHHYCWPCFVEIVMTWQRMTYLSDSDCYKPLYSDRVRVASCLLQALVSSCFTPSPSN